MPNDLSHGLPVDGLAEPAEGAPPVVLPLDFSGAQLVAADAEPPLAQDRPISGAGDEAAAITGLLVAHSFGDAGVLLPTMASVRRAMLDTIRAHHRIAGRPKRRHLLVCAPPGTVLPPELAGDAEVSLVADDMGAVRAEIGPRTAGLLVSPVRLAAGLEMLSGSLLADLRESADEYGLILAFDETDGGLGRTGMAFAHEWTGVTPDLMLLGEGAGLPLAALVMTQKVARGLPASLPRPEAAAVAQAAHVVQMALAAGFEARIQALGWMLEDRLATLRWRRPDLFTGLAGTGLMQGLVCPGAAEELAARLAQAGLFVRAIGCVLAFLPPLTVTEGEIAAAAEHLEHAVAQMEPVPA
ncbi:aminotransferase class III-fold pyridoxal phosphate-dependent enzyme [Xanthobacter sp. AM11]|uniref:aminotransferase class III-fold pyridoxal phosphate-dependent enzyme n=1 Tax=Xanthobacter sp. AM11 TaxID=3380643 RepID=UPI0039BF4602